MNDELDRLRHAATAAILTRKDVIIVASFRAFIILVLLKPMKSNPSTPRGKYLLEELTFSISEITVRRVPADLERGKFRVRGNRIEISPLLEKFCIPSPWKIKNKSCSHVASGKPRSNFGTRRVARISGQALCNSSP